MSSTPVIDYDLSTAERKAADCSKRAFRKVTDNKPTKERAQWRGVPLIGCLKYWVRASGAENPCKESLQRLPPGLGSNGTLHAQHPQGSVGTLTEDRPINFYTVLFSDTIRTLCMDQ